MNDLNELIEFIKVISLPGCDSQPGRFFKIDDKSVVASTCTTEEKSFTGILHRTFIKIERIESSVPITFLLKKYKTPYHILLTVDEVIEYVKTGNLGTVKETN